MKGLTAAVGPPGAGLVKGFEKLVFVGGGRVVKELFGEVLDAA